MYFYVWRFMEFSYMAYIVQSLFEHGNQAGVEALNICGDRTFRLNFSFVLISVSAIPEIKTGLEQASQDFIFTDAITTVTTEITFNDVVTNDVKFDMYTSLDFPDFLMKTPARVKMGPNLHVTGSLWPEYDAKDSFSYPVINFITPDRRQSWTVARVD